MKLLTLTCALLGVAHAQNAGVTASVSEAGAQYLLDSLLPIIVAKFSAISIPPFSTEQDGFDISADNIVCNQFSISSGSVTLSPSSGVGVALDGLDVSCAGDWRFKLHSWPHVPDGSGSVDASLSSATAAVSMAVTRNGSAPVLTSTGVSLSIGGINITFHGSAWDWLLNLLKGLFSDSIKSAVSDEFAKVLAEFIDVDANAQLEQFKYTAPLHVRAPYNIAEVRFGLTADPVCNGTYLGVQLQGDVVNTANPVSPPLPAPALPAFDAGAGDAYVQMHLSSYTALSAVYTYFTAGLLTWTLAPSDIPLGFNTTTAYVILAPGFPAAFPGAAVGLLLTVPSMPQLVIAPTGIAATVPTTIAFIAENGTANVTAFTLNANASLAATISIGNDSSGTLALMGQLEYLNASLAVGESNVGPVNTGLLQTLIDVVFSTIVVPIVNDIFVAGIPLPSLAGIQLTDTSITLGSGYVMLSSDFIVSPNITVV